MSSYCTTDSFDYIIWGHNQAAELLYQYITNHYPKAALISFVDDYHSINFHGKKSDHSTIIEQHSDAVVFVTSYSAVSTARDFLNSIGHKDFLTIDFSTASNQLKYL